MLDGAQREGVAVSAKFSLLSVLLMRVVLLAGVQKVTKPYLGAKLLSQKVLKSVLTG